MSNEYTFQSVFDKLCRAAYDGTFPSIDRKTNACRYIEGKHRCVAGLFMTEDECKECDNHEVSSIKALLNNKNIIIDSLYKISESLNVEYEKFWSELQNVHDSEVLKSINWNTENFISNLRKLSYFKDCE